MSAELISPASVRGCQGDSDGDDDTQMTHTHARTYAQRARARERERERKLHSAYTPQTMLHDTSATHAMDTTHTSQHNDSDAVGHSDAIETTATPRQPHCSHCRDDHTEVTHDPQRPHPRGHTHHTLAQPHRHRGVADDTVTILDTQMHTGDTYLHSAADESRFPGTQQSCCEACAA